MSLRATIVTGPKVVAAALAVCAVAGVAGAAPQVGQRETLSRARNAYYNLRRAGLVELRSNVKPNWDLLLTGVASNPETMKLLHGLQFSISIDSESKLRIDHHADQVALDQKLFGDMNKIFAGMEGALSRFIATWSIFVINSPFPAIDSSFELSEVKGRYHFSHKEGATEVLTVTDKDFLIVEIKASGNDFVASLKPKLEMTPEGLLLKGYSADYRTKSRNTVVNARLDYESVSGLRLLHRVNLDTVYEGKPGQLELTFTDYQVTVR